MWCIHIEIFRKHKKNTLERIFNSFFNYCECEYNIKIENDPWLLKLQMNFEIKRKLWLWEINSMSNCLENYKQIKLKKKPLSRKKIALNTIFRQIFIEITVFNCANKKKFVILFSFLKCKVSTHLHKYQYIIVEIRFVVDCIWMVIDMGFWIILNIKPFGDAHQMIEIITEDVVMDLWLQKILEATKWLRSHPKNIHAATNTHKSDAILIIFKIRRKNK